MRPTLRLASYIAPFSPTGLTGLLAHPAPRPSLIAIYNTTLTLLNSLPSHSVYRTSTTTLTRHRLDIVTSITPPSYQSYEQTHLAPLLPSLRKLAEDAGWPETKLQAAIAAAQVKAQFRDLTAAVPENAEGVDLEGLEFLNETISEQEKALAEAVDPQAVPSKPTEGGKQATSVGIVAVPPIPAEPPLTAEQVAELEGKLEAGLIEEVIKQGVAEMKLVKEMLEAKPWEPLVEEPVKGQWEYFERKAPVQNA
ncbi:hypothetical protein L211DRAFT_840020 [Terfezia boudieri ATCC MYA-4762]|uniref:NADH-ubiquinone oxidoreductase 299 kDa subunit n=1 Tax=Terfezia boudieri ATCC MYA-4762 TaxID=1051890 RepID=A0A3N4LKZ0_9PEZI|nr:hypothetical protein L211DRAFT_840020 [Terfezia boudieri ATCC MYA-4762]